MTIQFIAVKWSISTEEVRRAVKHLLFNESDPEKKLLAGVDILDMRRKEGSVRKVRKSFFQFRINKKTGVPKIEAYLFTSEITLAS